MKEYKVGEQIVLEVKEQAKDVIDACEGCFFEPLACMGLCESEERSDGKNVIFVEKGK